VISSFPAGLGEVKIDGEGLTVRWVVFIAGVERPVGVGGGGVGLPESSLDGSSAIWDLVLFFLFFLLSMREGALFVAGIAWVAGKGVGGAFFCAGIFIV